MMNFNDDVEGKWAGSLLWLVTTSWISINIRHSKPDMNLKLRLNVRSCTSDSMPDIWYVHFPILIWRLVVKVTFCSGRGTTSPFWSWKSRWNLMKKSTLFVSRRRKIRKRPFRPMEEELLLPDGDSLKFTVVPNHKSLWGIGLVISEWRKYWG